MISYYYRTVREEKLAKLEKFRTGAWIYVEAPSREELEQLQQQFNLDPDLLVDALDPDEIPRTEVEDDVTYVYMRYAYRRGDVVDTDPVLVAVGPNFVVTIARHPLPNIDRFLATTVLYTTQRAKLMLLIVRYLVSTYEAQTNYLNRQIRAVRAKLNVTAVNNRDFVQFVLIEDALNSFLAELVPANLLLQSLMSGRYNLSFHEEDHDLIEDLVQATRQLNETSRSSLTTIVNIREAYSNIMTNNLNRRVGVLTSLTVVLTIPTIVFSLWGMNVSVPGHDYPHAFALITLSTLVVIAGLMYWLYKRHWL